jgi:hypothetical protein
MAVKASANSAAVHWHFLQAVKSLGKTLRAFQPTIREIASVSSDLRSSLEEQIGLDDIRAEFRAGTLPQPRPRSAPPPVCGAHACPLCF